MATQRAEATANVDGYANPETLLDEALYPADAYRGTIYWGDLPLNERTKFVNQQANFEAGRELKIVWEMFKQDPLSPISAYMQNFVITGVGFFTEGYVLFSVGNILPLFESVWASCFKQYKVCNKVWVEAANYLEIVGIIFGQVAVGIIGDLIGRRWGLIQDAAILLIGSLMLTGMWGKSLYGWTVMYAISLLVFGFGVGGEYPMTSVSAMEGVHGQGSTKADRLHRGRSVLLAFLMQGWGQLANQLALIVVMLIFHHGGNPPYGEIVTQETFRITFFIAALFIAYFLYLRVFKMKNVDHSLKASRQKSNVTGYDITSLKLTFRHYWHRLFATAVCWYCNDFPFYGNQIFRSLLLTLVTSNSNDVFKYWLYNLINVGCELAGYYLAAFLIDHKFYGRKRMQAVGFIMSFILFLICAAAYPLLNQKPGSPGAQAFIFLYFFSSFWIQFGPNSTTFLLAAEVYPAQIRATAHGMSAAVGKLGALTSTVLYNYIPTHIKFWVVCWFGLIGFALTMIFIPDTTGIDLREQERYWQFVREGREHDYHGVAVHPRHLSLYENVVLKRSKAYDPKLDRDMKVEELRQLYHKAESGKAKEYDGEGRDSSDTVDDKVSSYFEWEKSRKG
ncbi:hypothetical protein BAUCODRAFT_141348 [Baudoinia panamericana UAMH 10762]|uniref:Major facilitator superfamily (MFS) profile domain-containing protein n=1 Tax=Baudoinia panamericana (strain UAMH 10762) TaxID=717646 RepID=M2MBR5_BAUPA|nr:uncharacterized protein BAUCODRAFT_141348 [Baudoinia panamericana UAMH 10762]EMC93936.1 hypothetical protein BAUCODRAFT_141348 [Baudoinia panamericana UAMH 10762]